MLELWALENEIYDGGVRSICGVDEAGRGPLAGPVCAAAVVLPRGAVIEGMNDSKKLSEKRREALFDEICDKALEYSIAFASVEEIEKLNILKNADAIVREELDAYNERLFAETGERNSEHSVWQYFAVLPDIKSVGVMGDERTYARPVILRAVESSDAMTADWARLPYDVLARISGRIVAEVPGVNRVVYDITSKPPATIEWE